MKYFFIHSFFFFNFIIYLFIYFAVCTAIKKECEVSDTAILFALMSLFALCGARNKNVSVLQNLY